MKKRLVFLLVVLLLVTAVGAAAAATYYRVNTSWLKLHQLPDYNSTVMDSYRTDFACTIVKKVNATWSKIRFTNGKEGYAVTSYLSPTKKTYSAWITDDDTNLRTGPSTTFSASGTLAKGTKVTVLSHGSAFDYVKSGSVKGYVRNTRLSTKKVAGSGKASSTKVNYTAWVSNGNRTVNFRSAPNTSVTSVLRAYPTGTKVTVHEHGGTWDYVEIAGTYGYMMNRYLTTSEPIGSSEGAPVDPASSSALTGNAWVTCPNQGSVNVHRGPGAGYSNAYKVRYGWQVKVISQVDATWYKIEYNGQTGYIMGKYLTGSKPWDAPETPAASADSGDSAPASSGTSYPYTATITCAAGEKVNVRQGAGVGHSHIARLDPGTQVSVLKSINSEWAKISVNGITGYVMKKFLK